MPIESKVERITSHWVYRYSSSILHKIRPSCNNLKETGGANPVNPKNATQLFVPVQKLTLRWIREYNLTQSCPINFSITLQNILSKCCDNPFPASSSFLQNILQSTEKGHFTKLQIDAKGMRYYKDGTSRTCVIGIFELGCQGYYQDSSTFTLFCSTVSNNVLKGEVII